LAHQGVIHDIKLSNKIVDVRGYLRSVVIDGNLVLASLHLGIDSHGAETSMGRVNEEAESGQLVLALTLGLIVARWRRRVAVIGVIVEVAEGNKEGRLLGLGLLEVLLLERLLIKSSL
jgi:hypothetical protein